MSPYEEVLFTILSPLSDALEAITGTGHVKRKKLQEEYDTLKDIKKRVWTHSGIGEEWERMKGTWEKQERSNYINKGLDIYMVNNSRENILLYFTDVMYSSANPDEIWNKVYKS